MNSEPSSCPQCGSRLPDDAPQGLCPRCLGALNFATETMPPDAAPFALQAPLRPEEIAPHFPQLEILECLGRGGMGVVYKARQKSLNRIVALKLLAPERAGDAKFAARFEKEAQALAALNHPHIVTIHDFGQAGGFFYLLMEFVDGVNLRQAMSAGRFTPDQALAIVPPVCEALQYAHERGIVHRDIKPENLLLDKEGRVKIADFGIAKMLGAQHSDAAVAGDFGESRSQPFGTPAYSAPEQQSAPRHVDHRADIYSLGVVLYELLTGELPKDNLEPPSRRVQIDVRLDEVVLRALEAKPELRFATAAEFRTQLAGVVASFTSEKSQEHVSAKPSLARRWFGAIAFVILPVLLILAMLMQARHDPGVMAGTSQGDLGISGRLFVLQLLVLASMVAGAVWMIRVLFKSRRTGCAVILLAVLIVFGLGVVMALVWYFAASRPPDTPGTAAVPSTATKPVMTAWEARLYDDLLKWRKEEAELGKTLGAQHPRMKAAREQIVLLENLIEQERRKSASNPPSALSSDPRFLTTAGTRSLNSRYTLEVSSRQMVGKDGASRMRGYTLKDNLLDGAQSKMQYAPLAIDNELFIIFWDRDASQLWLASPTILRWHHLPQSGPPAERIFFAPDIPEAFKLSMPTLFREAVSPWHAKKDPEGTTNASGFLQNPRTGRMTLIATLKRVHYFGDDVPGSRDMVCFRVSAGKAEELAFLKKPSTTEAGLRESLSWEKSSLFIVTLTWHQDGGKTWLELLEAHPFTMPVQK